LPLTVDPIYYRNLARLPGGEMSYNALPDVPFHLSIVHALTLSIPPEVPFLPGHTLHYHYGMDLLSALLAQGAGVDSLDLASRFVPTFLFGLLVLSAFCFARCWLASQPAAWLATLLVIFGEDLSWLPGLLRGSGDQPWCVYFYGMPNVVG